jgi:hypothetical protein
MERKIVSDKNRFLRGLLVLIVMLAAGTIVDFTDHVTLRSWFTGMVIPVVLGGCIAALVVYLTMKLNQKNLTLPQGL